MENVSTRTTPRPDSLILRKLAELKEREGWAHHVADAATGKLLTTRLRRPVAPLTRAERLSRLGHQFDPSIFGTPTYRLTPRHPYQASPTGFLGFLWARLVSSYSDDPEGYAFWALEDIVGEKFGEMSALLFEPPHGRCLLTLELRVSTRGEGPGRLRIEVQAPSDPPSSEMRVIASFQLAVHGFIHHTFDLVFVSAERQVPTDPRSHSVQMYLEPGSGLDTVTFLSLTLAPQRPLDIGGGEQRFPNHRKIGEGR
jgi:hypothetical protein